MGRGVLPLLLEVRDLKVSYGDFEAVHGISFSVAEGELVSIIGANGAGKTTVLRAIMGLTMPSGGVITFMGRDITQANPHDRARMGIRMVPERARVFPQLTVGENLRMGAYGIRKDRALEERMEWVYHLFPVLKERLDQLAVTLSGGEQQQLAIGRALISDPKLLLVDEVSMGLMPKLVDQVFQVLGDLNRSEGMTILLVEQNALASLGISHRGYILQTGRLELQGSASELISDQQVREAYLGV